MLSTLRDPLSPGNPGILLPPWESVQRVLLIVQPPHNSSRRSRRGSERSQADASPTLRARYLPETTDQRPPVHACIVFCLWQTGLLKVAIPINAEIVPRFQRECFLLY